MSSKIAELEIFLPPDVETNDQLRSVFPGDLVDRVEEKTGIVSRHICPAGMTALDMAEQAGRRLLERVPEDDSPFQYIIYCTQSPDHFLPSGACILQNRLGLSEKIGAFDFNLGCSGYVYGLDLADALIGSGRADRVLLLTGDTYSRFINPLDHANRLLFGDAASATLIERSPESAGSKIGPFLLRTDGKGADNLIVPAGGARLPHSAETAIVTEDANGACRSQDNLHMNGREIFMFTISAVRDLIEEALAQTGDSVDAIDWYVLHQANRFVLNQVSARCEIPEERVVEHCAQVGNTVSTSIPLALKAYLEEGKIKPGQRLLLVGFGVGYSWGTCHVTL